MPRKKSVRFGSKYLEEDSLSGFEVQGMDTSNPEIGTLPLVIRIAVSGGAASANIDTVLEFGIEIIKAWVHLEGAGTTSDTVQLLSSTNAITEALDISTGSDHDEVEFATFDNAYKTIAAAGTLRVAAVDGGGTDRPDMKVYVLAVRT